MYTFLSELPLDLQNSEMTPFTTTETVQQAKVVSLRHQMQICDYKDYTMAFILATTLLYFLSLYSI